MPITWGSYTKKPVAQQLWDKEIRRISAKIVAQLDSATDWRPRIKDQKSGRWALIDSGAAISCWPRKDFPQRTKDHHRALQAVNGSTVPTYGSKVVNLKLENHYYSHTMTIADVQEPILGWDFLLAYKMNLMWTDFGCTLYDSKLNRSLRLSLHKVPNKNLNLAPVSFRQYAQQEAAKQPEPAIIPPEYRQIIYKFPAILKVLKFKREAKTQCCPSY